jgi:hypothetical protein
MNSTDGGKMIKVEMKNDIIVKTADGYTIKSISPFFFLKRKKQERNKTNKHEMEREILTTHASRWWECVCLPFSDEKHTHIKKKEKNKKKTNFYIDTHTHITRRVELRESRGFCESWRRVGVHVNTGPDTALQQLYIYKYPPPYIYKRSPPFLYHIPPTHPLT